MVQVQELLELFDKTWIDGPIVMTNFIFRRVQPYMERVHLMYLGVTGGAPKCKDR
jgi:hypothetical protein